MRLALARPWLRVPLCIAASSLIFDARRQNDSVHCVRTTALKENRMRGVIAAFLALLPLRVHAEIDLAKKYPATLDSSDKPVGHEWVCEHNDVWQLESFALNWGDALKIDLGPA